MFTVANFDRSAPERLFAEGCIGAQAGWIGKIVADGRPDASRRASWSK
jgi:hypothetical protein